MATERQALVKLTNYATAHIISATIGHKYSSNYKNSITLENISDGNTAPQKMHVQYNTGAFTTGKDWWKLDWMQTKEVDGKTVLEYCRTNPTNFRSAIDIAESLTKSGLDLAKIAAIKVAYTSLKGMAGAAAAAGPYGVAAAGTIGATAIATGITAHLVSMSLNDESTAGFKQHILREDDERDGIEIQILNNGIVKFISKTGVSETVYERREL